jgi:hypothetical protein
MQALTIMVKRVAASIGASVILLILKHHNRHDVGTIVS